MKRNILILSSLTGLFLVLILLAWWRQEGMFSRDGVIFLRLASLMREGEWARALVHPQHPLTSWLIAFLWESGFAPVFAGRIVSVGAVAGVLLALFYLVARNFGAKAASWSVVWILLSSQFLKYSCDILSDPLYWFGLFGGVALLVRSWDTKNFGLSFSGGLLLSASYLSRPEGFVMMVLVSAALLAIVLSKRQGSILLTTMVLGFALGSFSYVKALHEITGEWRLSLKINFVEPLGFGFFESQANAKEAFQVSGLHTHNQIDQYLQESAGFARFSYFYEEHVGKFLESLGYPQAILLLFSVPYLWSLRRQSAILLTIALFQLFLVELQWFDDHYLSKRHWMVVALAIGALMGPAWLYLQKKIPFRLQGLCLLICSFLAIESVGDFFKSEEKRRKQLKIAYLELGQDLHSKSQTYMVSRDLRTAWFAQKAHVQWPELEDPFDFMRRVHQKLGDDVIVLVPLRRTHSQHTTQDVLNRFKELKYHEIARSDLEVALVRKP